MSREPDAMRPSSRQPQATRPSRIGPLATLPLFFALSGKPVLLAGAGQGAVWKAELLAASGAEVHVASLRISDELAALADAPPSGSILLLRRDWTPEDLDGKALAVCAANSAADAARFAREARARGVPVNVVDRPEFCDFSFGAIVNRSPLVVGISTSGAAPVLGQGVRAKIEALLPMGLGRWAAVARDWRPRVQARLDSLASRRAFWRRFTMLSDAEPEREPTPDIREKLLDACSTQEGNDSAGRVFLVGAGPGSHDLLTLRAVRILQSADVILYDDLVAPAVLELARREAERFNVGKRGHAPSCTQGDINDLLVNLARAGRRVVRLKNGDPMIFGRAGEEIRACELAGIPFEVVPGVSAAQGAAASLGLSLTNRGEAQRVLFMTGHVAGGDLPHDIDWRTIADPHVTTVVYMPRRTVGAFQKEALAAGLSPEISCVVVVNATCVDERSYLSRLGDIDQDFERVGEGPALLVVGEAARHAHLKRHSGKTFEAPARPAIRFAPAS